MSNPLRDRRTHSSPNKKINESDKEVSVDKKQTSGTVELSTTKINRWVDSESSQDEDKTNEKLFQLSPNTPQRNVREKTPDSLSTRPHTEPGRNRDQSLSVEKLKKPTRQSAHKVTSSFTATSEIDKIGDAQEDWIVVEKLSSHTNMPCDPDDDSNVLVPGPKEKPSTEQIDDSSERTRVVLSNKYGSTFQVLPQKPDPSITKKEQSTQEKLKTPASNPKGLSISGIGTFAAAVSKFKRRSQDTEKVGFSSLSTELQQILKSEDDTIQTEIPEAMMKTIKEEAYQIMLKTTQAYRSQVGARHRLTRQAYEYSKELRDELSKP